MSKSSQAYYDHQRQFENVELLEREYLINLNKQNEEFTRSGTNNSKSRAR